MFGFSYWFIPLFSGCCWLGGLLAMLGTWTARGSPRYAWLGNGQRIAYISDIGATGYGKPIFIATSAVMVVTFDIAFIAERWLRHRGRLTRNYNITEKILSIFAIIFAIVGACGLIFLTIFDTKRYPNVHDAMLAVFIAGYVISAVFICAEYQRLGMHFREHRVLRASFWIKLAFIFTEVGLAIAFGVTRARDETNAAAVIEWIIALIYIFYVWSFVIDFLPATRTKHKDHRFPPIRKGNDPRATATEAGGNMLGGPVYTNGGRAADTDSYGSTLPMTEPNRYYQPPSQQHAPASQNF
ncbi:SFK1-like membrane protein [Polychaeton citri CBS 116435]|uniref:SFK1-like membrane protein n=1 Tax=Polychaeton citri CBS 116435 TaxID=1314669 RepID=A0A9P4QEB3_9PEZI|nr:SFK1-like membrane protein [Polychaeton citri CBS 116435]